MDEQIYNFQLSSADEQIIRTYKCTQLRKLLFPPTVGYLTITNKRILFHSTGKSVTGKSELINDMPLEDAASVSAYLGMSINWLLFIVFAVALYALSSLLDLMLPHIFMSWVLGVLLMLPMAAGWILSSNLLNEQIREQAFQSVDNLFKGRYKIDREQITALPFVRIPFWIGLTILVWDLAMHNRYIQEIPFLGYALLLAAYFGLYIYTFGRHRTFSLLIGSKTMKDSGIYIPGDSFRLIFSRDNTAVESISANPSVDSEKVVRELGALLLDIRQLGDLGIQKWTQN
jgi:hypothetical protein